MKLSTKQKQDLIDSYVQNKDIRTDYEIVANTRTQMSFESLDKNLSLLSAIVNKHFIKGKWQKKLSERIIFDCWHQRTAQHTHSHIFLIVPPIHNIKLVIMRARCAWYSIGIKNKHLNFDLYVKKKHFGTEKRISSYNIREFYDDVNLGLENKHSRH